MIITILCNNKIYLPLSKYVKKKTETKNKKNKFENKTFLYNESLNYNKTVF